MCEEIQTKLPAPTSSFSLPQTVLYLCGPNLMDVSNSSA